MSTEVLSPTETGLRLRMLMLALDRQHRDVAREAGVAIETLSRVLHGKQAVSPQTLRRIESAIIGVEVR